MTSQLITEPPFHFPSQYFCVTLQYILRCIVLHTDNSHLGEYNQNCMLLLWLSFLLQFHLTPSAVAIVGDRGFPSYEFLLKCVLHHIFYSRRVWYGMIFLTNIIIQAPVKIFGNCDKGWYEQRLDLTWCVRHDSTATCEYLSKDSNVTTCFILHKCCRFRFADVMLGPQLAYLMCSATNRFIFRAAVFTVQVKGPRGKMV